MPRVARDAGRSFYVRAEAYGTYHSRAAVVRLAKGNHVSQRRNVSGHPDEAGWTFLPLTAERWPDLETLFGRNGACAGCWDMYLRLRPGEWGRMQGEPNHQAFRQIVMSGTEPGIIAYAGNVPAGWCAVEPREAYPALARSRLLHPVDDEPVWAITCFFVHRAFRRRGLITCLLREAVAWAQAHGARIIEGYPIDPGEKRISAGNAWRGTADLFRAAGFTEVARRAPDRPIMRYSRDGASSAP